MFFENATINMLLPLIKQMPNFEEVPLCSEIDSDYLKNFIQMIPQDVEMIGNSYFEKNGIDYGFA